MSKSARTLLALTVATSLAVQCGAVEKEVSFETALIKSWIAKDNRNLYGDEINEVYTGGSPLFDENTGTLRGRDDYVVSRHSTRPWLCDAPAAAGMMGAPMSHPVTPGVALDAGVIAAADWAAHHIEPSVSEAAAAAVVVFCVKTQVVAGINFYLTVGVNGVAYKVVIFRSLPSRNGGDGTMRLTSTTKLGELLTPKLKAKSATLGAFLETEATSTHAAAATNTYASSGEEKRDSEVPLDALSSTFVGGAAVLFVVLIGVAGGFLVMIQRRPVVGSRAI